MLSDEEYEIRIKQIVEEARARTNGTEMEKKLAVIESLLEFSLRGLHEINKRVAYLEDKSKHNI
jgi:hypothetical protein